MKLFKTSQGQIFYRDEGQGTPLLFSHGTPSSSLEFQACWQQVQAERKSVRFIAPDHLGFGKSEKPKQADYSLQAHSQRFTAWADSLDLSSVHLVLHDFGGPIALPWAVANVDRIESLTLINTWFWPFEKVDPSFLSQKKLLAGQLMKFLYLNLNISPRFLVKMAWGTHNPITKQQQREFTAPFPRRADRSALYAMVQALLDSREFWQRHPESTLDVFANVPCQILWGMQDPLIKPVHLDHWRLHIPTATIIQLPHVGHFPLLEDPITVAGAVESSLES